MSEVLILTGGPGHEHDFDATTRELTAILDDQHHITVVTDPDTAADRLRGDSLPDVFVVNALRNQMLDDCHVSEREQWAYHTPGSTRAAIESFVRAGGGLIGMHTAAMCFDDWPQWLTILGGRWNQGRSAASRPQTIRLWITEVDHSVVEGLGDGSEVPDQVFSDLDLHDDALVLGWAKATAEREPEPVMWVNTYGAGRIVCDGFGHDVTSLAVPAHRQLISQAVAWVVGRR